MRKLITVILLALTMSLSITAIADEHSTLRLVRVQTHDLGGYVAKLSEGKKLIAVANDKFTLRAWRATLAGEDTGSVIVAVEYPGSFGEFAMAWDKLIADPAVRDWLHGFGGLRTIVSESLYNELAL